MSRERACITMRSAAFFLRLHLSNVDRGRVLHMTNFSQNEADLQFLTRNYHSDFYSQQILKADRLANGAPVIAC
jgi:hypothetical protein